MTPGSQPASMPAESNRFQQTPLISTARSFTAEIDPSWEIRALAAEPGSTLGCNGASSGAPLCANPHTPVCGSQPELATVPTVEQAADTKRAAQLRAKVERRKKKRAEARHHKQLLALAEATKAGSAALLEVQAERDGMRSALAAIRDALAVAQLRHAPQVSPPLSLVFVCAPHSLTLTPALVPFQGNTSAAARQVRVGR